MYSIHLSSVHTNGEYLIGRLVKDGFIAGYAYIYEGNFFIDSEYPVRNGFGY